MLESRIEALTLAVACSSVLGISRESLGERSNIDAQWLPDEMEAWQNSDLHLENKLRMLLTILQAVMGTGSGWKKSRDVDGQYGLPDQEGAKTRLDCIRATTTAKRR